MAQMLKFASHSANDNGGVKSDMLPPPLIQMWKGKPMPGDEPINEAALKALADETHEKMIQDLSNVFFFLLDVEKYQGKNYFMAGIKIADVISSACRLLNINEEAVRKMYEDFEAR